MLGANPNKPTDDEWREKRVGAAIEYGKTHASLETDDAGRRLLEMAIRRMSLTNGQYQAIMRVARVIANLDASEWLKAKHIAEAVQYRADATIFRPERVLGTV
jgi:magnesium chelatase family protein